MPDQNELPSQQPALSLEQKLSMWMAHLEPALIELRKETDRGAALFSASLLDQVLQQILEAFLVKGSTTDKLFKYPEPLSSFSARQNLCLTLGLISKKEYEDCTLIRKVRNEFAHVSTYSVDFEDDKISGFCKNLSNYDLAKTEGPSLRDQNRAAFIFAVSLLHIEWTSRIRFSKKNKRTLFDPGSAGPY